MDGETLRVSVGLSHLVKSSFALDVSFEAKSGITILFGASGAGKSTTLGAIAGLVRPERGRVSMGEDVWFDAKLGIDCPVHKRRVAYVFQSGALFPHLNALRNVEYGIDRALSAAARRDRAFELLERMKVRHLAERKPRTFAGGEAQRVALARAFATQPRVVLLDEAFSAMDRALRHELGQELRGWSDENRVPIVMVTHHRMEAKALGDRVVCLEQGHVTATGRYEDTIGALES